MLLVGVVLTLSACSFVELEPQAQNVFVAPNTQALAGCAYVGRTNVSVWSGAENLQSREKMEEQLNILARNFAVEMGANAVAPASEIRDGQRMYQAYNCSVNRG